MNEKRSWNPMLFIARKLANYLPANKIAMNIIIPFLLSLFAFAVFLAIDSKNWKIGLVVFIGMFFFGGSWMIIGEVRGRKKHKAALEGNKLSPLHEFGFVIENVEEYWGYAGVIENYYLKIYYDWNQIDYPLSIMLYFTSPKTNKGKIDVRSLEDLHDKYQTGIFSPNKYKINFQAGYFQLFVPFTFFTDYEDVKSQINFAIEIAKKEILEPISENEVKNQIEKTPWLYGPTVETYPKKRIFS